MTTLTRKSSDLMKRRGIARQDSVCHFTLTAKLRRFKDTRVKAHGKSTNIQRAKERKEPVSRQRVADLVQGSLP